MKVTLIQINGNTQTVLLGENLDLVTTAIEAFSRRHYEQNKNGARSGFADYDDYIKNGPDTWRSQTFETIDNAMQLMDMITNKTALATHRPQVWPVRTRPALSQQVQLPRKQLPQHPVPTATRPSQFSHPNPAVPREHQRVEHLQDELRRDAEAEQ